MYTVGLGGGEVAYGTREDMTKVFLDYCQKGYGAVTLVYIFKTQRRILAHSVKRFW